MVVGTEKYATDSKRWEIVMSRRVAAVAALMPLIACCAVFATLNAVAADNPASAAQAAAASPATAVEIAPPAAPRPIQIEPMVAPVKRAPPPALPATSVTKSAKVAKLKTAETQPSAKKAVHKKAP